MLSLTGKIQYVISIGPQRGHAARSTGWREPAATHSAARHNAALRVHLLQCGIRLSRELSGEEPEVQRLSRHASAAAARTRARRRRAAEWSRNARQLDGSETAGGWRTAGKPIYGSSPAGNDGDAAADASHGSSSTRRRSGARIRARRRRAAEWSRRERAPPHDAVCVPLRCLPCSRARQHVRDGFASPCPAIPRERRHRGSRVAALLPRGERMGHGAL